MEYISADLALVLLTKSIAEVLGQLCGTRNKAVRGPVEGRGAMGQDKLGPQWVMAVETLHW